MDLTLLDTDSAIEAKAGRAIAEIFAESGEEEFRRIEEEVIREALETHDGILSLGGGAVTTPEVRAALAGHTVVFLEISASEGVRRTSGNTARPLLAGADHAEKYRKLMNDRIPLYREVATVRVNTNRRNPGAVVRHIVARLENPQPQRRRMPPWRRNSATVAKRIASATKKAEQAAPATPPSPAPPLRPSPATVAARRNGIRK